MMIRSLRLLYLNVSADEVFPKMTLNRKLVNTSHLDLLSLPT